MKTTTVAILAGITLALAGCGAEGPTGLHPCTGDEVALILSCGHKSAPEQDIDGREMVTCRIGAGAENECILDGGDISYHCMPAAYCEALCGSSDFACE